LLYLTIEQWPNGSPNELIIGTLVENLSNNLPNENYSSNDFQTGTTEQSFISKF